MRPRAVLAIAYRDLRMELRGMRGLLFAALTAGLLLPAAAVPVGGEDLPRAPRPAPAEIRISGDIPPGLGDAVQVVEDGPTQLARADDGAFVVHGGIPHGLRQALDELDDAAPVTVRVKREPLPVPGRTLLLALISSSVMMGALSESLAGERARRTLSTLLAAAVSRLEIVVGKWFAWTAYGAGAAMLSAGAAIASGAVEPGLWLLPLPVVPATTVALGLYLVRRARDVVAGATISLRVLPAALMTAGITAWFLGRIDPLLGAAVPLGGALLTAGSTWAGVGPPLVATAVTAGSCALLLHRTARDLSDDPGGDAPRSPVADLLTMSTIAAAAWFAPVLGPLLWAMAGNPTLTEGLAVEVGALAGGAGLILVTALRVARDGPDVAQLRGGRLAPIATLAAAIGIWAALEATGLLPTPINPTLAAASERLTAALQPRTLASLVVVVVGQELVFRGILQRAVGPGLALVAFVICVSPHDPLRGLALGLPLAALATHARSPLPGMAARLVAAVGAALLPGLLPSPTVALGVALVAGVGLWVAPRADVSP